MNDSSELGFCWVSTMLMCWGLYVLFMSGWYSRRVGVWLKLSFGLGVYCIGVWTVSWLGRSRFFFMLIFLL